MGDFKFKVSGFTKASGRLDGLNLSYAEASAMMRLISKKTESQTVRHFETGRGPEGKWKKLSAATKKINPRRRSGHPLSDKGQLKGSITTTEISPFKAVIGTNLHYAKYHQFGPRTLNMFGRGIRKTLPRRMFLGWSKAEAAAINRLVANFLAKMAK